MKRLWINPPVKIAAGILTAVFVLGTAAGIFVLRRNCREMTRAFIRENLAVAGGMSQGKPANRLCVITGKIRPEDVNAGTALLQKYSYDEELPIGINRYYQTVFDTELRTFIVLAAVLYAASLAVTLAFSARVYGGLRTLTRLATAPGYNGNLPSQGEGDFAALQNAVNQLASRTYFHINALKKDKEFLKNLMSDISHQLKTPLAALRMYNEILISKPSLDSEKRLCFLQRSQNQLDRTDWLIQGLLKMARVEAGVVEMHMKERYLIDTVCQSTEPFLETARQNKISLLTEIPTGILFPHDGDWVAEAFGNMIKNALEHTPAGGTVKIAALETPLTVEVNISDTGTGMEQSEIPHIFERFYRKNTGINPASAGIGLSLAKEIIEKNNGDIYVKSAHGHGSELIITFLKKS